MIQAAVRTNFDFSTADLRSRRWWLKLKWTLDQIEDENVLRILEKQHAQHTSVIDYTSPSESFDSHWKAANEIMRNMYAMLLPYAAGDKQRSSEADQLMAQWKATYGDIKDPKVKAHFNKVAEAMKKRAKDGREAAAAEQAKEREKQNQLKRRARRKRRK